MYNTQQRIEEGREAMRRNPARDITAFELYKVHEEAGDPFKFGEDMFLFGVAVGMRLAREEGKQ